jgi:threonine dehydrogenase-like Zn-dependent dehydrogenase
VDRGVFLLPEEMSLAAGVMIEPLACVIRGQRLAALQPGQSVLVLGSGISGILHIMLARALGAGRILATDVHDYRCEAALRFGAEAVADAREDLPDWVRRQNDGCLADTVIVCAGAPSAFEQALHCVDGAATFTALPPPSRITCFHLPLNEFWRMRSDPALLRNSPLDARGLDLIRLGRVPVGEIITTAPAPGHPEGFHLVAGAARPEGRIEPIAEGIHAPEPPPRRALTEDNRMFLKYVNILSGKRACVAGSPPEGIRRTVGNGTARRPDFPLEKVLDALGRQAVHHSNPL